MTMNFVESLRNCLTIKYCSTRGRASRSEYWWFMLFSSVTTAVLENIPVVGMLVSLAFFLPIVCVSSRRLHDIGLSGWWQILPLALSLGGALSIVVDTSGILCILGFVGGLSCGLYFGVRKGTAPGMPNPYGGAPDSFHPSFVATKPVSEKNEDFVLEEEEFSPACPNCGKPFAKGARFCGNCGHAWPAPPKCPSCGIELKEDSRFCTQCGAKLKD